MFPKILHSALLASLALGACAPTAGSSSLVPSPTEVPTLPETTKPVIVMLTETMTPFPTDSPFPTETDTPSPIPVVESLKATVSADLLSCRYGPGSEYLYLYGLRKGANIKLIGQTGGNNWVWVDGKNKCWVNAKFIGIAGDPKTLPIVYPGLAKLPVSPYFPPTTVLSATRNGNMVEVHWLEVPVGSGYYEDENMQPYIVEVWRCEGGQIIFDPLATSETSITFVDETGCAVPSHGRVFVQEKHGFAGPAEIPWPQ